LLADEGEKGIITKLTQRYRYLFLDEFQDTDPTQLRIVELLLPSLKAALLIGDEKQSIYGFRGGYMRLTEIARGHGVDLLPLSIARRPTRKLLELQNVLFNSIGSQQEYGKLNQPLEPADNAPETQSALPAMIYIEAGGYDDRQSRIVATGDLICQLQGRHIDEKDYLRPLEPGDIAILFRDNDTLNQYERTLAGLLPAHLTARKEMGGQFFRRDEIIHTYRVLRLLIDYPNDVVLAQALRTPYLAGVAPAGEQDILRYGGNRDHKLKRWFEDEFPTQADQIRQLCVLKQYLNYSNGFIRH
jgi:ATP-dependent exoDNAse (exonuclease V) beta subunit